MKIAKTMLNHMQMLVDRINGGLKQVCRKSVCCIVTGTIACGLVVVSGCTANQVTNSIAVADAVGALIIAIIKAIDPMSGADLANFDASQALINLSLSNATVYSTSGTATITVTDAATGATIGQTSFGYIVRGNSLYAANPAAVNSWLQQFTGYSEVDVAVQASPQLQTTSPGSASATSSVQYQGTTYASAYAGWSYSGDDGSCPHSPCYVPPNQVR